MADRIDAPIHDLKRTTTDPAIRVAATAAATGPSVVVEGEIVADTLTGAVTGLTFPIELTATAVDAAALWTALAAAGILVEPA